MKLTIHRGAQEIGGSCVAIESEKTRILIDLGLPLDFDQKMIAEQTQIRLQAKQWTENTNAIFISHYHRDHHGLLAEIEPNTPIYTTEGTAAILELNPIFTQTPKIPNIVSITSKKKIRIGSLTITPFTVDHSAFDACAFLIEGEDKKILYSGDIRTHGKKGSLFKDLPQDVDYLLLEGTQIRPKITLTKNSYNVEEQLVELFKSDSESINYVWCSGQNIDRLIEIYRASLSSNKIFAADIYVANILEQLHSIRETIPSVNSHRNFKVFFPPQIMRKLTREANYEKYAFRLNPKMNKITYGQISKNPSNYVVIIRPSLLSFLQLIKAPKANVIISIWRKYAEQDSNFSDWIKDNSYQRTYIHASGHADVPSLQEIVSHIKPKAIIPIHTENAALFPSLFPSYTTLIVNNNLTIDI